MEMKEERVRGEPNIPESPLPRPTWAFLGRKNGVAN